MQSQNHGFLVENEIRQKVFGLPHEQNNTDIHDIPCQKNRFNPIENVSIKTSKSDTVCCGDIMRFLSYDFTQINTIMVVQYKQIGAVKQITYVWEGLYDADMFRVLFGSIDQTGIQRIKDYVSYVKSIPHGPVDAAVKQHYKQMKQQIQELYGMTAVINPKVDSKGQRRVQVSIPKAVHLFLSHGKLRTDPIPQLIRGIGIQNTYQSRPRQRAPVPRNEPIAIAYQ